MGHLTSLGTSGRVANSEGPVDERRDLGWCDGMGKAGFYCEAGELSGPRNDRASVICLLLIGFATRLECIYCLTQFWWIYILFIT